MLHSLISTLISLALGVGATWALDRYILPAARDAMAAANRTPAMRAGRRTAARAVKKGSWSLAGVGIRAARKLEPK